MQSNMKLKPRQVYLATILALSFVSFTAMAEDAAETTDYTLLDAIKGGKNMTSFRLRYEEVQQDGKGPAGTPAATKDLKDGEAFTLRSLIGWQTAPFHNLSFAAQLINVAKLQDDYNDGTSSRNINGLSNQAGMEQYAKIVDPDNTGINQLFVDWTGIKNTKVRLGRQAINLDNVRFIGDIGFRQVMQVFDGISVLNKSIPDTEVFAAHIEDVKQINTRTRYDGTLEIANVKYRFSPTESLSGYGYLSKFDNLGFGLGWFGAAVPANAKASQANKTLGLRLDGVHKLNDDWKGMYTAEYAKQDDYDGGDSRIDAHYYKVGGGAMYGNFGLRVDEELLSSNNGLFAFQTPFGTNHLFQGWVDKFLVTPKQGIKDDFVTATYKIGDFSFFADYHILTADENFNKIGGGTGDKYGKEWNVSAAYAVNKNILTKVEYGQFKEDDAYKALPTAKAGNFRDTNKLWLTAMYTF